MMTGTRGDAGLEASAFPAWMLLGTALAVIYGDPWFASVFAIMGLASRTFRARERWTECGDLGWANLLTWARIVATAALPCAEGYTLVGLAFAIFALDGVDGAIARARGTASAFGAELDKECDAFFIAMLVVLLWLGGVAGSWVLIAGLWRYAYSLLIALGPAMRPAPRSQWGRYSYSTSSVCLIAALIDANPIAQVLAAFATVAISASFVRSLYYSVVVSPASRS